MINVHAITLAYGDQPIFNNNSFLIQGHQRVGLVGRNGAGKSTLLKAIVGQQYLDGGSIAVPKNKTIAYLSQDVMLDSSRTILQEALTVFSQLQELLQEKEQVEHALETMSSDSQLLERYAVICERLAQYNPAEAVAETQRILLGLGFKQEQLEQPVTSLSGGWKMRLVLAQLLLKKADFYLFDEPTNHLDIIAKDWFLQFLKKAPFGFIMVCHERYFLDQLCDTILELEWGQATFYTGNYSSYEQQKEQNLVALEAAYAQQQREIQAKMATVNRFRASASKAKMAQSMLKSIEKIERITLPPSPKLVQFNFPPPAKSGAIVLTVDKVAHAFESKTIFRNISCEITRGEKVALIAPNGVGKTTLFNLIAGKLSLQMGQIAFGYNVKHALFDQEQHTVLPLNKTILEVVEEACPQVSQQVIRTCLGAFLFSGDDITKKVGVLSGGEKNRVGMVRLLLQGANVLLLDEPTNHLDIPSKEILLKALQDYKGTILFVSHDHDFLNKLATRCIELRPDGAASYTGNYDAYLYAREFAHAQAAKTTEKQKFQTAKEQICLPDNKERFALNKKSRALEQKIETLEQAIKQTEQNFAELTYGTPEFMQAQKKLQELQQEHERCFVEWTSLQSILDTTN